MRVRSKRRARIVKVDFLIVGQGLAGSLLAWQLLRRDQRILVVDRDEENTSSKIAAGLVTPITGPRFSLPPGLEDRLAFAKQFYWDLEETTGTRLFHHRRIARLFRDPGEQESWERRKAAEPERTDRLHEPLDIDPDRFHAPHGGFEMKEGGWLDVPAFLELTRQTLLERAAYAVGRVADEDVDVRADQVRWKNVEADHIVFAQGWRGNQNRFFDWISMNPVLGDVLELSIPDLRDEQRIVNKGGWMLPLGGDRFRAGSTYRHDFDQAEATPEGRQTVCDQVNETTPAQFEVLEHHAAIRPAIRRSRVFCGRHPSLDRVAFLNGFGSKGVVNGPWHAAGLAAHLVDEHPLPVENDLRRQLA